MKYSTRIQYVLTDKSRLEQLELLLFLIVSVCNHLKLGEQILWIYYLDLLFHKAHTLRTLFNI